MAKQRNAMKHVMTGISYMIPIVVAGGILGALAKAFGGWNIGSAVEAGATPFSNLNPFTWVGFWWGVNKLSSYAMDFAVADSRCVIFNCRTSRHCTRSCDWLLFSAVESRIFGRTADGIYHRLVC